MMFICKLLYAIYIGHITAFTTIQVDSKLLEELKGMKTHPGQSYAELIFQMASVFRSMKQRNQYDEFLHKVQIQKMKELWDNEDDGAWEHA